MNQLAQILKNGMTTINLIKTFQIDFTNDVQKLHAYFKCNPFKQQEFTAVNCTDQVFDKKELVLVN